MYLFMTKFSWLKICLIQTGYFKGFLNKFWSVFIFWWSTTIYLLVQKNLLFQSEDLKGSDKSWNSNYWSVYAFSSSSTIYLVMRKIWSLGLMMWKLDYFSQNIWKVQIGLRTRTFGQFLHFDIYKPLPTCDENFESWAHDVKIRLF